MEGRGAKRTRDETEGEAVAPVVQAPARGEVTTSVGTTISDDNFIQLMAMLTGMKQEMNAMRQDMDGLRQELKQEIKDVAENVNKLEVRLEALANQGVKELNGVYDSVRNARWSFVVMSDKYSGKWLGMGVLDVAPGEQPHLWSEAQADVPYDPEEPWEGDEVPDVSGKLVMAVLSSQKGWPYMLFSADDVQKEKAKSLTEYNAVCDAYIRKENLRVWHIVKGTLNEHRIDANPFIVIGTPGIGKSFATGSLLLYQLLHYPAEWLKAVAYFVNGKAYIFHREERRVVYYEEQQVALRNVNEMVSKGVKGYIIFDISGSGVHIGDLPYAWGIVLISSPKASKFHEFTTQRYHTVPIYMNCYEDVEFKAALVWERHSQVVNNRIRFEDVNLENDWKVLKKRIDMVGPLPRYVLSDKVTFEKRVEDVDGALRLMRDDLGYYMDVLDNQSEWRRDGTTHKLVKLVRCEVKGKFECRNRVTSIYVLKELARKLRAAQLRSSLTYHILCGALEKCACLLEELSLDIFTLREAVDTLVKHLEHLPRGNEAKRESVLCQRGANGRVPTALSEFASDSPRQKLVTGRIYKPLTTNFPLVDGFFVVEGVGLKTIVLVQVTKAKEHHTKKTTVNAFREYMGKVFEDWENIEKAYTWELIYVQHVDSTAIKRRQNCSSSEDAANDTDLALWDRIHQYQVTLNKDIANTFMGGKNDTFEPVTINGSR
ncbi:unnamed protein product [Trypanosoma congolense IL3000]|uniref:WGS project CAEQ00000000 data, annotated contig 985 n=1 Tax=Trypanosoma congolense (strain IL3000) TaxID=1068625 RepID=F9WK47_TRYCI|nr:unnamed protein product [Trypanosoma congolense IL3000]